jgi:hypothetical protein
MKSIYIKADFNMVRKYESKLEQRFRAQQRTGMFEAEWRMFGANLRIFGATCSQNLVCQRL